MWKAVTARNQTASKNIVNATKLGSSVEKTANAKNAKTCHAKKEGLKVIRVHFCLKAQPRSKKRWLRCEYHNQMISIVPGFIYSF